MPLCTFLVRPERASEEGADANFVANGFYPPHLAANGGNVEIINLLVEAPHIMNDVLFTNDMVYPPQVSLASTTPKRFTKEFSTD
ncbi:hypothetical protein OROGR_007074 [Orobanche gracilis]